MAKDEAGLGEETEAAVSDRSLLQVFQSLLLKLRATQAANAERFYSVLCQEFGVTENEPEFFEILTALQDFVNRIRNQIETAPLPQSKRDRLMQVFGPYTGLFNIGRLNAPIGDLKAELLREELVSQLDFVEIALDALPKMSGKLKATIAEIRQQLETAQAAIGTSDLPPDVKALLVEEISRLIFTLRHFEIFGSEIITRQTNRLIGSIVTTRRSAESENAKQAINSLAEPLRKLGDSLKNGVDWARRVEWIGNRISDAAEYLQLTSAS